MYWILSWIYIDTELNCVVTGNSNLYSRKCFDTTTAIKIIIKIFITTKQFFYDIYIGTERGIDFYWKCSILNKYLGDLIIINTIFCKNSFSLRFPVGTKFFFLYSRAHQLFSFFVYFIVFVKIFNPWVFSYEKLFFVTCFYIGRLI